MISKVYKHKDYPGMIFFKESYLHDFIKFMKLMKELYKAGETSLMYDINNVKNESTNN